MLDRPLDHGHVLEYGPGEESVKEQRTLFLLHTEDFRAPCPFGEAPRRHPFGAVDVDPSFGKGEED